jgi:hypothetical protein
MGYFEAGVGQTSEHHQLGRSLGSEELPLSAAKAAPTVAYYLVLPPIAGPLSGELKTKFRTPPFRIVSNQR